MSAKRSILFTLTGLAVLVGGFLLAQILAEDTDQAELEKLPSTVSVDDSGGKIPGFAAHGQLPPLEVSTTTVELSDEGISEPEYEPEPEYVPTKEEKTPYVPPSTTAPEVTIGK